MEEGICMNAVGNKRGPQYCSDRKGNASVGLSRYTASNSTLPRPGSCRLPPLSPRNLAIASNNRILRLHELQGRITRTSTGDKCLVDGGGGKIQISNLKFDANFGAAPPHHNLLSPSASTTESSWLVSPYVRNITSAGSVATPNSDLTGDRVYK